MAWKKKNNRPNPYKIANEQYLAMRAEEEGMIVLESGVLMKRLQEGHGTKCPKTSSIVFCNYTGRLIDGTVFDSTEGEPLPACFVVRDRIMGWQIALCRMHEGDKYEVIIPAKYGYGALKMDDIPAHSTLIFELELIKMELR